MDGSSKAMQAAASKSATHGQRQCVCRHIVHTQSGLDPIDPYYYSDTYFSNSCLSCSVAQSLRWWYWWWRGWRGWRWWRASVLTGCGSGSDPSHSACIRSLCPVLAKSAVVHSQSLLRSEASFPLSLFSLPHCLTFISYLRMVVREDREEREKGGSSQKWVSLLLLLLLLLPFQRLPLRLGAPHQFCEWNSKCPCECVCVCFSRVSAALILPICRLLSLSLIFLYVLQAVLFFFFLCTRHNWISGPASFLIRSECLVCVCVLWQSTRSTVHNHRTEQWGQLLDSIDSLPHYTATSDRTTHFRGKSSNFCSTTFCSAIFFSNDNSGGGGSSSSATL